MLVVVNLELIECRCLFIYCLSVVITASEHPVTCVNNTGHVTDWFDSLSRCLNWNVREVQKSMA